MGEEDKTIKTDEGVVKDKVDNPNVPNETKIVKQNDKPTLDSSVFQEDVKALVEKVREEEKAKLYHRLETMKNENVKLKSENKALTKRLNETEKVIGEKDSDKEVALEKVLAVVEQQSKQIEGLKDQIQHDKEQAKEEKRELELQAYREKKIAEAKGNIIPELVVGTSESEIDASVISAKQRFHEIVVGAGEQKKIEDKKEIDNTPVPPVINPQVTPDLVELSAKDIQRMPLEEWSKKREGIIQNIKSGG